MCGIAGCYQQADGHKLVDIMSDHIAHRGPDASGTWGHEDDRVAVQLGHRRLSIIDLSAAADQPLSKHGLTLVYNGELYNYRALRAELAARGARFGTSSDTEVVLEAWRAWGPEALPRFRGMFAFAIFDERSGELFLARDPLGIKPLYFLPRHEGVVFASELKALVAAMGAELQIEPGALVASMPGPSRWARTVTMLESRPPDRKLDTGTSDTRWAATDSSMTGPRSAGGPAAASAATSAMRQ